MKRIILASASALVLSATGAAAQAPGAADNPIQLDDIVVTAERVEQTAQRAPIALSVVSTAELTRQNVTRAEDLARAIPALVATNSGGPNTVFFVRGVGNFTVNAYSDPSIAFNYDGVYVGRPTSTSGVFYDLQRVEVLKGPQGTLYGRNATGGAINVIPNKPEIGETGGAFQIGVGNYSAWQGQGSLNLAVGENAAVRLSGTFAKHDAYLSDGTSDQDDYGLRAQFLANITPSVTARVGVDYAHQGGVGSGSYQYGVVSLAAGRYSFSSIPGLTSEIGLHDQRTDSFLQTRFFSQAGRTSEPLGGYPSMDSSYWGVTGELNWATPIGDLTVVPAYRRAELNNTFTSPGFRGSINDETDEQKSLEVRLSGKIGDKIDYLAGGYYFDEDIDVGIIINQLVLTPFQNFTTGTESKAVFGKLGFHPTDRLTITAAGRYTEDDKAFNGLSNIFVLFCGNPAPPQDFCPGLALEPLVRTTGELRSFYAARGVPISTTPLAPAGLVPPNSPSILEVRIPINATTQTDKFTYRVAADYRIGESSMIYAAVETGFHGGGFSFARGLESYKPETITAYTMGSKNRFLDNRLQVNLELFLWKYKDQQFSQFGFDLGTPPASVFFTANVGATTNQGVDIDVDYLVTEHTRIGGNLQYLDSSYDTFISYSPNQGTPPNNACPFTTTVRNGVNSFAIDCSGRPAFNAPRWSFNLNLEQTVPLGEHKLVLALGTRYRSDFFVAPDYQPWSVSRADFQSNASVTLASEGERWFVTGYVSNIEDNRRILTAQTNAALGLVTAITTPPRTYGVRVGAKF